MEEVINKFCVEMICNNIYMNISDFIRKINTISYKYNLDLIEDIIRLTKTKNIDIPHIKLYEYGICNIIENPLWDIADKLSNEKLKANIDYKYVYDNSTKLVDKILLSTKAFMVILIKYNSCNEINNYFIFIKKCTKLYDKCMTTMTILNIEKSINKLITED